MNPNHNHGHTKGEDPHSLPVRFAATDSSAGSVLITRTFNNWPPEAKPIRLVEKVARPRRQVCRSGPDGPEMETGAAGPGSHSQSIWQNGLGSGSKLAHLKPPTAQPETLQQERKNK
jgi:hypothetical protein